MRRQAAMASTLRIDSLAVSHRVRRLTILECVQRREPGKLTEVSSGSLFSPKQNRMRRAPTSALTETTGAFTEARRHSPKPPAHSSPSCHIRERLL